MHVDTLRPLVAPKKPAAHGLQLAESGDALNCPAGHAVHDAELLVLNWPAGHDEHVVEPAALNLPAGHGPVHVATPRFPVAPK